MERNQSIREAHILFNLAMTNSSKELIEEISEYIETLEDRVKELENDK